MTIWLGTRMLSIFLITFFSHTLFHLFLPYFSRYTFFTIHFHSSFSGYPFFTLFFSLCFSLFFSGYTFFTLFFPDTLFSHFFSHFFLLFFFRVHFFHTFFPKASPMLGFSFSHICRGGARRSVGRRWVGDGKEGKE